MQITDVRVRKVAKEGKLKAVVSITMDEEFVVHDIKVIEGEKGLFIAMPSKKALDGEYRDIAHPINSATRERIQSIILEKYEAGIVLHGTEVKSLRMGKCSIKEAFIRVENGEMFIYGMHISPYEKGNIFNKDPLRVKKLLLHRKEIDKIFGKMKEQGITVVPLQVYFSGSLVKVEIGLAKGKKLYDKRADIAKKDQKREAQREFKIRNL